MLVVEDDDDLRTALTYGLESEGFVVTAVPSASAAFEVVADLRPDLVLLDWWLSEGEQGAAACSRMVETSGAPVVMHTGMSDARDRAAAYRAGAAAFLQKGMPLEELARRLREVLGGATL